MQLYMDEVRAVESILGGNFKFICTTGNKRVDMFVMDCDGFSCYMLQHITRAAKRYEVRITTGCVDAVLK